MQRNRDRARNELVPARGSDRAHASFPLTRSSGRTGADDRRARDGAAGTVDRGRARYSAATGGPHMRVEDALARDLLDQFRWTAFVFHVRAPPGRVVSGQAARTPAAARCPSLARLGLAAVVLLAGV